MYTIWIERRYPLRLVCRYHGYHQLSYIRLWLMNWWNLLWWTIDIGIVSNKIKLRLNRWNSGRILVTHTMTSSNGNTFRVTGHLRGEFTDLRWIPRTKASDAELWCFFLSVPERLSKQSWGWWFETHLPPLWAQVLKVVKSSQSNIFITSQIVTTKEHKGRNADCVIYTGGIYQLTVNVRHITVMS